MRRLRFLNLHVQVSSNTRPEGSVMHRKQVSTNIRKTRDIVLLTLLFVAAIAAGAARAQTYTNLHSFAAGTDGADPTPIIRDEEGNIYGATRFGGIPSCNLDTCGTVFKIDSAGKETVLYRFEGGNNGSNPLAGLARDAKGNLYGTTQGNGYVGGASVVFKVNPQGHQTVLFVAEKQRRAAASILRLPWTRTGTSMACRHTAASPIAVWPRMAWAAEHCSRLPLTANLL